MNEPWAEPDYWRFRAGAEVATVSQQEIDRLIARERVRARSTAPWSQRLRTWLGAVFARRQPE